MAIKHWIERIERSELGPDVLKITVRCTECKIASVIHVDKAGFQLWWNGQMSIVNALFALTPEQKELFNSGICGDCYGKVETWMPQGGMYAKSQE